MQAKQLIMIMIGIIFLAGCTNNGGQTSTPQTGTLSVVTSVEDNVLEQGESTSIELDITNMLSNKLENVEVRIEPLTTGITYEAEGAETILANTTSKWNIDLSTSPGLTPRIYNLYPLLCFDYTQDYIGYFRVANGEPTAELDNSLSENGPLIINIEGLQSFNAQTKDKLDVSITFSFNTNLIGVQKIYADESELTLISADFKLDTVDNSLTLYTNENDVNAGDDNYCIVQTGGSNAGYALCYFTIEANNKASDKFDFDIKTNKDLISEIESSFTVSVAYNFCAKSTGADTSINVVSAE